MGASSRRASRPTARTASRWRSRTQDLKAFCKAHYDPAIGARGLPGFIQANIEPLIVNSLIEHPERRGVVNFRYDAAAGDFVAAFEPLKDAA